jgi:hypothetical protein
LKARNIRIKCLMFFLIKKIIVIKLTVMVNGMKIEVAVLIKMSLSIIVKSRLIEDEVRRNNLGSTVIE